LSQNKYFFIYKKSRATYVTQKFTLQGFEIKKIRKFNKYMLGIHLHGKITPRHVFIKIAKMDFFAAEITTSILHMVCR
jgi:hypothetical protein